MIIKELRARAILASMGGETVEAEMVFEDESRVTASVPAGISAGKYEAAKVPAGEGVQQIVALAPQVVGRDWTQEALDQLLAGKSMGANASLAVSAAFFKAEVRGRTQQYEKFPKLMVLLFEGGKHGSSQIKIQEFLKIEETIEKARVDFETLRRALTKDGTETLVGAEGGFSPVGFDDNNVLTKIKEVFSKGEMAIDAAGSFSGQAPDFQSMIRKYGVVSIEDPFGDEEWEEWKRFYQEFGDKLQIVGDDLTVTNPQRIARAGEEKVINAVIIKPNQNGTISGAKEAVRVARETGLKIIVSHRGEETDDDWIADFALAVEADAVKFGATDRGERVAKYNRLAQLGMK